MALPINKRPLSRWNSLEMVGFSDETTGVSPEIVFDFLEEREESPNNSSWDCSEEDDENSNNDDSCNVDETKKFWKTQHDLLQATLYRTSSLETRIRQATKEALRGINQAGTLCVCRNPVAGGCRDCRQREISVRLQMEGYDCAICKSKWQSSHDIPSGEHAYLEVLDKSTSKRREVRVVIELNFRAEFEIARGSEEYNELVNRIPEVFVGKAERLSALIKILCSAAKKCMKEKNMHLGPWRKQRYMQSKWLGKCERSKPAASLPVRILDRPPRPRASMLTYDLLESLPILHCTAVKVL